MSIITRMRRQKAVYWAAGQLDRHGQASFANPVQIDCRWEDRADEFIDDKGEKKISSSVVYVDRDMKTGDVLMKGLLNGDVNQSSPFSNPLAGEIKGYADLPNLKNTESLRTAYL